MSALPRYRSHAGPAVLAVAGTAWSGAFGLFVLTYAAPLMRPAAKRGQTPPI